MHYLCLVRKFNDRKNCVFVAFKISYRFSIFFYYYYLRSEKDRNQKYYYNICPDNAIRNLDCNAQLHDRRFK